MSSNVHEALLKVYSEVGYVQKGGYNSNQKYRYAGERDLIEALRPSMVNNGIICLPVGVKDCTYHETRKTKNDVESVSFNAVATYVFRFIHAASGTHIDVEVRGEGADSLDKASYKAATGALKYALRQSFLIETGDEPEESEPTTPPIKREDDAAAKEANARAWLAAFADKLTKAENIDDMVRLIEETCERRNRIAEGYPHLVAGMDASIAKAEARFKQPETILAAG